MIVYRRVRTPEQRGRAAQCPAAITVLKNRAGSLAREGSRSEAQLEVRSSLRVASVLYDAQKSSFTHLQDAWMGEFLVGVG